MKTTGTQRSGAYWLVKTEPEVFSVDDWLRIPSLTTHWEGVRNYQARNFLRTFQTGDRVLVYYSNCDEPGVVGIAVCARPAYPDAAAEDRQSEYYEPRTAKGENPWSVVDLRLTHVFRDRVHREALRAEKALAEMKVLAKGSRLSVQPVTAAEFEIVKDLGRPMAARVEIASKK